MKTPPWQRQENHQEAVRQVHDADRCAGCEVWCMSRRRLRPARVTTTKTGTKGRTAMKTNEWKHQIQHVRLNLIPLMALAVVLLPALAGTAGAVPALADGDVEGLYDAVAAANTSGSPTTIKLAKGGTYILNDGSLEITGTITIQGNGATIDGADTYRVFIVEDPGNLTLNDLAVTGGSADYGAGICNANVLTEEAGGIVTLNSSSVSGNTATAPSPGSFATGGGIFNFLGTVTLNNSTVGGNAATAPDAGSNAWGGGISNLAGTVTLHNSTVGGNTAATTGEASYPYGGGIFNLIGTVTLNDASNINKNTATATGPGSFATGGGIFNLNGTVTLNDASNINKNTATATGPGSFATGGGIFSGTSGIFGGGPATVNLNDTSNVNWNTAGGDGGGIYNFDGSVTLSDSSSVNWNTAGNDGGGIYDDTDATLNLNGGTVLHNDPDDIYPPQP
jgi:fibronectin-binding autotransporter adhesin